MKLIEYISERGTQSDLARRLDVSVVQVHHWSHEIRQVPAERCIDIEMATDGQVTCEELRPDLSEKWQYLRSTKAVA